MLPYRAPRTWEYLLVSRFKRLGDSGLRLDEFSISRDTKVIYMLDLLDRKGLAALPRYRESILLLYITSQRPPARMDLY
jgi:hypothetical protein